MGKNLKWMKPVFHPVVLTIPFRSRSLPPSLLHFCVASRTDFRSTFRRISLRMKWQNLYLMSQLETAMSELQNLFVFFWFGFCEDVLCCCGWISLIPLFLISEAIEEEKKSWENSRNKSIRMTDCRRKRKKRHRVGIAPESVSRDA